MTSPSILGPIDSSNMLSLSTDDDDACDDELAAGGSRLSVDDAIERLGYGPFQVRVMVAAGLCFAADAMEVLLLSFLSVVLQSEWGLTTEQTAFLTSTVFLGALLGTLLLGHWGDQVGRRPVFILAACLISFFGIATAFCNDFRSICLTRMVVGFGVGGLTVPFDILAEVLPTKHRGKNLLYIEYFWTAGTLMVPSFAFVAIGNGNSNSQGSWRNFVVLCALPCIVSAILGTWLVPESPRWLASCGKENEALQILRQAATTNGLDALRIFPEGTILQSHDGSDPDEHHAGFCHLLSPLWRGIMIRLWVVWGCFAFLYYGTILSITLVFHHNEQHVHDDTMRHASFEFDYQALFISCSAEFFGTTFAILLIDRLGRIGLQGTSLVLGVTSVLTMVLISSADTTTEYSDWNAHRILLICLAFSARWFMMSLTSTCWVSTAEMFTTEIRTTGHSTANAVARIGGFIAPFCVQSSPHTLITTIAVTGIVAGVALAGLPETKGKAMGDAGGDNPENDIVCGESSGSLGDLDTRSFTG